MGRFACTHCGCRYHEQRFIWQTAADGDVDKAKLEQSSLAPSKGSEPSSTSVYVDVVHVTGTTSDITGAVAGSFRLVSRFCSSISVFADGVELVSGTVLLLTGIFTPSGQLERHQVAKAGVTLGTCLACTVIVAFAGVHPTLFFVAIGTDLAGLGLGSIVDATVPGLCPGCRHRCQPLADVVEEVEVRKHPNAQYEPIELLIMTVFGCAW